MPTERIQVILSTESFDRFTKQAKKQQRSLSNLAKNYISAGLIKDEEKELTEKTNDLNNKTI